MSGPAVPGSGELQGLARRALTVTGVVLATLVLFVLVWQALEVLLLLFAGVLLAVLLRVPSVWLSHWTGIGERWSVSVVLALLLGASVATGWIAGPDVARESQALASGMVESLAELEEQARAYPAVSEAIDEVKRLFADGIPRIWSRLGGLGATLLGGLGAVFIVLFVGIFFAFNPRLYLDGLLRLVPLPRRTRACEVLAEVGRTLRGWLLGQMISMLLLWLSTWLVLHLLGVPLAFILALLTGLLTFIPYLGPLLAAIPIGLVAFAVSPSLGALTLGCYLVIQNIESNVVMPLVLEKTVKLPPALSVASQLLMASVVGTLGVLLATPLLAVAIVLVRMLYVEDALGDSMDDPVDEVPGLQLDGAAETERDDPQVSARESGTGSLPARQAGLDPLS